MSKYLVTLTPTGKFFFGGDMRFGINGEKEEFSSYIIESLKMPQQTSLLGMMRFLLLSNSTLFNIGENKIEEGKKEYVDNLIGARSFTVNADGEGNTFGKIISLGPCFIYNKENGARYFRAAADSHFENIDWSKATTATINGKVVTMPLLTIKDKDGEVKPYTSKYYTDSYFSTPISQDCEPIKEDELFIEDRRIGINKDYEGKKKTNALYKQISYRLKDGFCFAFEIETDEVLTEYNSQLVSLGADSSTFIFEATEVTPQKMQQEGTTVVLLSDAYIPQEAEYKFSINKMRTFRFLETVNTNNASYYRINGKTTATTSERYELYEAGSVFYFDNETAKDEFCKKLESREDFNQIGYNKYYVK